MTDPLWEKAIEQVLHHEGGFVDHPLDPGGATNWGISLRFLQKVGDVDSDGFDDGDVNKDGRVDVEDIKTMERDTAVRLYKLCWWDKFRYAELPDEIAVKVFDLAINMGHVNAHKCLQRAVRSVQFDGLKDDGVLGPISRATITKLGNRPLLYGFRSEAAGHYRSLILKNSNLKAFEKGWLNRAYC